MPGWHEATAQQQESGKIRMLGIIQEQHPDRARLFMQWKEMGWPILVDSYNLLQVPYVPITLAIDEHGVIRHVSPPRDRATQFTEQFMSARLEAPRVGHEDETRQPDLVTLRAATRNGTVADWRTYADALAVWGGQETIDEVIGAYQRAIALGDVDKFTDFRLGVAFRMRHDSHSRRKGDFQAAVDHWQAALSIDPNQYIFRRRIQQYGPRLDKPYPFYDWVVTAREEITERGEAPAPLVVEPGGAEFAEPIREFTGVTAQEAEPDPRGRVLRDTGEFIGVETIAIPGTVEPGGPVRFHVIFTPNEAHKAHWNNEVDELALWIDVPEGWEVETRYLTIPLPDELITKETRTLEFEMQVPKGTREASKRIAGYALYYVCEDVNGVCMYRRQDVELGVAVRGVN